MNFLNKIIHSDVLPGLKMLPDKSAGMCVTSPPYWGLRDYGTEPVEWPEVTFCPMSGLPEITVPAGKYSLGLEDSPDLFVGHLVAVFREVKRVLRDDGVLWLNLGDSYAGYHGNNNADYNDAPSNKGGYFENQRRSSVNINGIKNKDLIGIPWRVAFALQADGWYLRQDIIWAKPNPMPESVTDRCTQSHEYIFLLSKSARYYYDHVAVQEPSVIGWNGSEFHDGKNLIIHPTVGKNRSGNKERKQRPDGPDRHNGEQAGSCRRKRSVWTVPTKPFKGAHFAVFPPDLIVPCIKAGSGEKGRCPECGARWVRLVEKSTEFYGGSAKAGRPISEISSGGKWNNSTENKTLKGGPVVSTVTTGWKPGCSCGKEPVPDVVLEPFSGSGTTAEVSRKLGRSFYAIELNAEYIELSEDRLVNSLGMFL